MHDPARFTQWNNPKLIELADLLRRVDEHLNAERYLLDTPLAVRLKTLNIAPAADRDGVLGCLASLQLATHALAAHEWRHSLNLGELLHHGDDQRLLHAARAAYQAPARSLLEAFCASANNAHSVDLRHKYPLLVLCSVLETPKAEAFGATLLRALDWYGQHLGESASPRVTRQLILRAMALDLDPHANAMGFDFQASSLSGKSIRQLRTQISDHLDEQPIRWPSEMRPLANWLLTPHLPLELQVTDIPEDLAWRRSNTWVHFSQGVNLAELSSPGSAVQLGFAQLCELSSQLLANANARDSRAVHALSSIALSGPLLHWGRSNGLLPDQPIDQFTGDEATRMLNEFSAREERLVKAIALLSAPAPMRLDLAREEMQRRAIPDSTRFVKKPPLGFWDHHWRDSSPGYPQPIAAAEVIAANVLRDTPEAYVPEHLLGPDSKRHPQNLMLDDMPDIEGRFTRQFEQWASATRKGCLHNLEGMLRDLPDDSLAPLQTGTLTFHLLRQFEFSRWELAAGVIGLGMREAIDRLAPLRGQYGFVIEADMGHSKCYYEVFPYCSLIRQRADLTHLPTYDAWSRVDQNAVYTFPMDAQAYLNGTAPRDIESSQVILEPILGPLSPDSASLDGLAGMISHKMTDALFSDVHIEALRAHCRGKTYFDRSSPLKMFIPLWGPIEDFKEGLATGNRALLRWALIGLPLDVLSLVVPGLKLGTMSMRYALFGSRLGLSRSLPLLRELGRQFVREAIALVNPFGALVTVKNMLIGLGRRVRDLFNKGQKLARIRIAALTRRARPLQLAADQAPKLGPTQHVHRLDDGSTWILHRSEPLATGKPRSFLIDPANSTPCGPALRRTSDAGPLTRRPAVDLPLEHDPQAGAWILRDEAPGLSRRWISWGDDHFLEAGGTVYRKTRLPDNSDVLRPAHSSTLKSFDTRLKPSNCRPGRSLRLQACITGALRNLDHSNAVAQNTNGSNIVPWFTDVSIRPSASGHIVHNGFIATSRGGVVSPIGRVTRSQYKSTVRAEVVGGNDMFKQIRVNEGIVETVADSRIVSAVVARRRNSNLYVMVTRLDDEAYYKCMYRAGDTQLSLQRIKRLPPQHHAADNLAEDEALHYIFNGSADAHHYFRLNRPEEALPNLATLGASLDAADKRFVERFIGGPFDMHTTPEQAALFCKFAQQKLVIRKRGPSSSWASISSATQPAQRTNIARVLNALHDDPHRFTAQNLLLASTTKQMGRGPRNLAYVSVTFKPATGRASEIHYSLSGLRDPAFDLALTARVQAKNLPLGWKWSKGKPVDPQGTHFINSQFSAAANARNPGADQLLYLPDLSDIRVLGAPSGQRRMLDSERMILRSLNASIGRFEDVEEMRVFSMKPTCQSCTVGLASLRNKLPPGRFTVLEGAV